MDSPVRPRGRPRKYPDHRAANAAANRAYRIRQKALRKARARSASDAWFTPAWLVDALLVAVGRPGGEFDLDPCAPDPSLREAEMEAEVRAVVLSGELGRLEHVIRRFLPVPARVRIGKGYDALNMDWPVAPGDVVYCNPPYSDKPPWLQKCIMAAAAGATVLALLPESPASGWWKQYVRGKAEYVVIDQRVRFVRPDGSKGSNPRQPSAVVIYGAQAVALKAKVAREIAEALKTQRTAHRMTETEERFLVHWLPTS